MLSITPDPERRGGYLLTASMRLDRPLGEVFPFFADALNLERITPPWMQFRVVTPPPIEMHAGQVIDYRLKIHGVPVRWRSKIAVWQPPYRFLDQQVRGPYRYWHHEHRFEETPDGTVCHDRVQYAVLGGAVVHRLLVRRDVETIFAYRQRVLAELLSPAQAPQAT